MYGRSSERLEHAQLELVGGQVAPIVEAEKAVADMSNVASLDEHRKKRAYRPRPNLPSPSFHSSLIKSPRRPRKANTWPA